MSAMSLIDKECVRQLLGSQHPDATLVFVRGDCVVLPAAEVDDAHKGLVIARRDEVMAQLPDDAPTDQMLDDLAVRLDNIVRDLGA
jgi:phosphoenolpyruvate carboxylase